MSERITGGKRSSRGPILLAVLATLLALPTYGLALAPEGFIENRGQIDETVRYYTSGSMVSIFLTEEAIVIDQKPQIAAAALGKNEPPSDEPLRGCALWIRFEGANPARTIEARGKLETHYNYFLGNDPEKWHADVPAYGEVVYRDIWPGIDLVFRQEAGHVTYDVIAAEGYDPNQIRFEYEGADEVVRNEDGSYRIETPLGRVVDQRPQHGEKRGEFGWALAAPAASDRETPTGKRSGYEAALQYSTYLGGNGFDEAYCIALDLYQNSVVAGMTGSTNFPVTGGAYDLTYDGLTDAFVAKIDVFGTSLHWATYLGGFFAEEVTAMTLDGGSNPLLTGWTQSHDFPTTTGAYDETYNNGSDVFVARLSYFGNVLFWSTYLGEFGTDEPTGIVRDNYADVYITGRTNSSGFPTTNGAYDESHNGDYDVFVAKVHGAGHQLLWSTFIGGSGTDIGNDIVLDPSSNVIVTGSTQSSGFPTTTGAFDETYGYGSGGDAFLLKLGSAGSALQWSTFLGASSMDGGRAVTIDASQNPIVAGMTYSVHFPTTADAYDTTLNGLNADVFLTKCSAGGDSLVWSTFLGGSDYDLPCDLDLDASGRPVLTGYTYSTDFPTAGCAYADSNSGYYDVMLSRLSADGSALEWSSYLGGSYYDYAHGLVIDVSDHAVITGYTTSPDFPTASFPGTSVYDTSFAEGYMVFVSELEFQVDTGVDEMPQPRLPGLLHQNSPNPCRAMTAILFSLPRGGDVSLAIYDCAGRLVRRLVSCAESSLTQM